MTKRKLNYVRLAVATFVLFWAMLAYMYFYTGKVQALEVISASMDPTIRVGDRLIVKNLDAHARPVRGAIVVIGSPDDDGPDLVKRLVGMPGDRLSMRNGRLFVNGNLDFDPRGRPTTNAGANDFEMVLGPGQFYVLGDNRDVSYDSTEFGPVDRQLLHGVVLFRYFPWDRKGALE